MLKLLISTTIATLFFGIVYAQTSTEQSTYVSVMLYPDTDHGTCNIGMQLNNYRLTPVGSRFECNSRY